MMGRKLSAYELERQKQINSNNQFLSSLGIKPQKVVIDNYPKNKNKNQDGDNNEAYKPTFKRSYSYGKGRAQRNNDPVRQSRRLRGEVPKVKMIEDPDLLTIKRYRTGILGDDSDDDKENDNEAENNDKNEEIDAKHCGFYTTIFKNGLNKIASSDVSNDNVGLPVTLISIGVTVWSIGKIFTGEDPGLYWSTPQCTFHHPYPVGYKASKINFGRVYDMSIEAGENGPLFTVSMRGGRTFTGHTPTQPWTQHCITGPSPGTRVSGPLFFGFSDKLIINLIEGLENYEIYSLAKAKTTRRKKSFPFMKQRIVEQSSNNHSDIKESSSISNLKESIKEQ